MFYFSIFMVFVTIILSVLMFRHSIVTSTYQQKGKPSIQEIEHSKRMTEGSAAWNPLDTPPSYCHSRGLACIKNKEGNYEMVDQLSPQGTGVFVS
jgi:hypothetical protein